ncbi:MAG: peptidyl-tRNA hydrolase [Parcubacteria group bacterium]|nr:peptidyl-tRNA hydrolase [Parcubacteria group bacterium]
MNKISNGVKLIIGLGNPGKEYELTRHNAGFLFIDALENNYKNKKVVSAKTGIFMNKSGAAVLALMKKFKIKPENVLIAHDDIDILWGNFKLSFGRSSAGHKGVESIIKNLKTKNFWRLRIGIQPAFAKASADAKALADKSAGKQNTRVKADKIILKKFTPEELKELDKTIKKAIRQLAPTVPSGLTSGSQ